MRKFAGVMEHCKILNSKRQITNKSQIPILKLPAACCRELQSTRNETVLAVDSQSLSRRSDGHGFVSDESVEEEHYCRNYNYS
jgi:hypothetical protein